MLFTSINFDLFNQAYVSVNFNEHNVVIRFPLMYIIYNFLEIVSSLVPQNLRFHGKIVMKKIAIYSKPSIFTFEIYNFEGLPIVISQFGSFV